MTQLLINFITFISEVSRNNKTLEFILILGFDNR